MIQLTKYLKWEPDFTRTFVRLSIPVAIQSVFSTMLHLVDNLMVAQLGQESIAALTQANRITWFMQLWLFGLMGATATFSSQFWGNKDIAGIRKMMGLSLSIALLISAVFAVSTVFFTAPILNVLIKDEEALRLGIEYLSIAGLCYIMQAMTLIFATVQKSTEEVKLSMYASIFAIIMNVSLNAILIFGLFGMPRLGVKGAAIATVIACAVEFLIVIIGGYVKKLPTAVRLWELIPDSKEFVAKYFKVVLPTILNEGTWAMGMMVYAWVYGQLGVVALAAIGIFSNFEQISYVFMRSICHACAVMVGKAIGVGDNDSAMLYSKRFLVANIIIAQISGLLLIALANPMLSLFNASREVLDISKQLIYIFGIFISVNAVCNLMIVGILRAGGDAVFSLYVDTGSLWVIGVPIVAIGALVLKMPLPAIMVLVKLEALVKALLCLKRFNSRKWINNLSNSSQCQQVQVEVIETII